MATGVLKRVSVPSRSKASEEVQQLAREAMVVLKHYDLADRLPLPVDGLSDALRRLDIKPFDSNSVWKYKAKKQKEAEAQLNRTVYDYEWHRSRISEAVDVPLFVLRKAVQVKIACPGVKLYIEKLEKHPDPFLVAKLGREEFYIEVWDEKDFEAGL